MLIRFVLHDLYISCSRTIQQLLRSRHEGGSDVGVIPPTLQDTLKLTDDATKRQVTDLANLSTSELWDALQTALADGSKAINISKFNIDKVVSEQQRGN